MQFELGMTWAPIVRAAGLLDQSHTPEQIYRIAGFVISDPIVFQRWSRKPDTRGIDDVLNDVDDTRMLDALCEMTPADKRALRQRIEARINSKVS